MEMAGGSNPAIDLPNGVWVLRAMSDSDDEGKYFDLSERTMVDSWLCIAGVCDGDDDALCPGGGEEGMREAGRETEKGMEWFDEKEYENDESPRYETTDGSSPIPIPLPTPRCRATSPNIHPCPSLRGGAGTKRLGDDERVPKAIWFLAGGVGRAPTGKGLREWKEKARKKSEGRRKKSGGFWAKLGLGMGRKGKKRKQKTEEGRKGNSEGAGGAVDGTQASNGGAVGGDAHGATGNVYPGVSGGESGAAPGDGGGARAGEGHTQRSAATHSSRSGSGSGSGSSGSGSSNSGRAE